jgi:probable F420-dependent oxidoreductase
MIKPQPFRFGVINEQMQSADTWVAQARKVEDYGYATFLIRDHFVPDFFGHQFAPMAALMAAASVTKTLRVGSLVFDNDYRHPVMLAKEVATLDLLSGGRFELGLGAGWLQSEYQRAGMPFDAPGLRISRLEEAIEPLTFAGHYYSVTGLQGFPQPIQRPHPPILIGGGGKRILTLAGRVANSVGILTTSVASGVREDNPTERLAASVAQKVEWVRQGAGDRFHEVELSMIIAVLVTNNRRQRAEQLICERGWSGLTVEDVFNMPSIFIGLVDDIVEAMEERRARYGFSYYVVSDRYIDTFAPVVARLARTEVTLRYCD